MNDKELIKQNSLQRIVFFAVIFALGYLLTAFTPLIADDFNYAFSWADETRIDNLRLVVSSMEAHRIWTHGRVFAQGWVTLFMMWPRWMFPLANGLVITLFFWEMERYFRLRSVARPVLASAVVGALIWICMPVFGQVFLWLDGTCNYSWGATLGFLLIEMTQSLRKSRWRTMYSILLLPLSFAVGAWSEHISFAVLVILFLFWITEWIHEKHLPLQLFLVLLACSGGYLYLMLAPSMLPSILKYRAKEAAGGHVNNLFSIMVRFWWLLPIVLTVVLLAILFLHRIPGKRERLMILSELSSWTVAVAALICGLLGALHGGFYGFVSSTPFGFLTLLALFLGGLKRALKYHLAAGGLSALILFAFAMYVPARGFCGPVIFIGIAAVLLWSSTGQKKQSRHRMIIGLALCFAVFFTAGVSDILSVHRQALQREEKIRLAQLTDGILVAEPYRVRTKYSAQYGLLDLAPDESWPNDYVKEYYRLREIIVVPTEEKA